MRLKTTLAILPILTIFAGLATTIPAARANESTEIDTVLDLKSNSIQMAEEPEELIIPRNYENSQQNVDLFRNNLRSKNKEASSNAWQIDKDSKIKFKTGFE